MINQIKRKTIVITGATSGIGLAAAKLFLEQGASVLGIGRSDQKINQAKNYLLSNATEEQITFFKADLSSQSQISLVGKNISKFIEQKFAGRLDALVNNAGVYMQKKVITEDGLEYTFAVNHLASFLLSNAMMPYLINTANGKIITISSYAHYTTPLWLNKIADPKPYIGLLAYKQSKLCNILFTRGFNQRFDQIKALAMDPGLVDTGIGSKSGQGISDWVWRKRRRRGMTTLESAQSIVKLLSLDNNLNNNDYYFRHSQTKKPSKNARSDKLSEQLWQLSNQLTGINWI